MSETLTAQQTSSRLKELADLKIRQKDIDEKLDNLDSFKATDNINQIWFNDLTDYCLNRNVSEYESYYDNEIEGEQINKAKTELKAIYAKRQSVYDERDNKIRQKRSIALPQPPKKPEIKNKVKTNIKSYFHLVEIIFVISIAFLIAVMTVFIVLDIAYRVELKKQERIVTSIIKDPGPEWNEWVATTFTNESKNWSDCESGWSDVESAWAERGLNVSWGYLSKIVASTKSRPLSYYAFKKALDDALYRDYLPKNEGWRSTAIFLLCVIVVMALILLVMLNQPKNGRPGLFKELITNSKINKASKIYNEKYYDAEMANYKEKNEKYTRAVEDRNRIIKKIEREAENEYRPINFEIEAKGEEIKRLIDIRLNEFTGLYKKLNAEKTVIENDIKDKKFSIGQIRMYDEDKLLYLAELIDEGRADNYKEAINIFVQEEAENEYRDKMQQIQEKRLKLERESAERAEKHRQVLEDAVKEKTTLERKRYSETLKQTEYAKLKLEEEKKQTQYAREAADQARKAASKK